MSSTSVTTTTKPTVQTVAHGKSAEYGDWPLWTEQSAINKQHREGIVRLRRLGFENDEQAFPVHGGPQKAVLQYNPLHYPEWRQQLKHVAMKDDSRRDKLLSLGGFGENIAVQESTGSPPMDETIVCIGDLVTFGNSGNRLPQSPRMRISGPRLPCSKLNHRFGISDMSQRAQDQFSTGWFYSIETEGDVEVGSEMILLQRPFPGWPLSRIQHYLFKDTGNLGMIKEILAKFGEILVFDVRKVFENRLTKGVEDMSKRLKGEVDEELFSKYRLISKKRHTDRVSEFCFERTEKLSEESTHFATATPGSHINLRFKQDELSSTELTRPYSIISGDSNTCRVGVALADQSKGGSIYLHRSIQVGDALEASEKFSNTFPLQPANQVDKHVFLAGGIGITAFLDHMRYCMRHQQKFHLHYMIRNQTDLAFRELIEDIVPIAGINAAVDINGSTISSGGSSSQSKHHDDLAKVSVYNSADGRRMNVKSVLAKLVKETRTDIYVCGSEKLSDSVRENARSLKISEDRLHYKQFAVDASGDPFVAELVSSRRKVEVKRDQSLLEALREAGLDIGSSCEAGNCGTCKIRVKCGRILHKGTSLADDEKAGHQNREDGEMLSCVSRGMGTIKLDL